MAVIRHHVNLQAFNTFGIPAQALHYAELNEEDAFADIMQTDEYRLFPRLIIGGGSNILFTRDFEGLVIRNCLKGISLISENEETVLVEAASGENWHQFVQWCIAQGYGG